MQGDCDATRDFFDVSEAEVKAAAADARTGVQTINLYKPLQFGGREVTELTLDFTKITGEDLENIESQMGASGAQPSMRNPVFSATYCMYIAARAAGLNIREFKRLNIKDVNAAVTATQLFFVQ